MRNRITVGTGRYRIQWLRALAKIFALSAMFVGTGTQAEPLILAPLRILDVSSGRYSTGVAVYVVDGRIGQIGPLEELERAHPVRVVGLPGVTLIPGFIDCHTHLLYSLNPQLDEDQSMLLVIAERSDARRALAGAANAREDVMAGITTVRDLGNSGVSGAIALRDAINAGDVPGPRMLTSTRALSTAGGQFKRSLNPAVADQIVAQEYRQITDPYDARNAVREAAAEGADLIKVIGDSGGNIVTYDELAAIVDQAHNQSMKVSVHAVAAKEVTIAINAGVDSIEHAYFASHEDLKRMAMRHIFLVPTDSPWEDAIATFWREPSLTGTALRVARDKHWERQLVARRRLREARDLGVPIAFGSDMYHVHPSKSRGEASLATLREYVEAGLTPQEALTTATINAAALLGLSQEIGSIEEGKSADMVGVIGDPLRTIAIVLDPAFVMARGTILRQNLPSAPIR